MNQWAPWAAIVVALSHLGGCAMTPPAEFQAYPGERRSSDEHAIILSVGSGFLTNVDNQRVGSMRTGGYPPTVFVLPGIHSLVVTSPEFDTTTRYCVKLLGGHTYSVVGRRDIESGYKLKLHIGDNTTGELVGREHDVSESC